MSTRPKKSTKKSPVVAGWRELVHLPDLGIGPIIAKLDTGARTAALHAENLEIYQSDEGKRIRFDAFVDDAVSHAKRCVLPLAGKRRINNTGGGVEERALVKTRLSLGGKIWTVEITLTDRAEMGVPMLLGRATMKRRMVVHPGKSFVLSADERTAQKTKGRKP